MLPSTYIYAINLGEVELDATSRQHFCTMIPHTHLVQIWLKELFDSTLRRRLLHLLENNRPQVAALYEHHGMHLPNHEPTMWRRLKSSKRHVVPFIHAHPEDVQSQPSYKRLRQSTESSITDDKTPKKKRSKQISKHAHSVSSTQRRLDAYFVPTDVPTSVPTKQAPTSLLPTTNLNKRPGTQVHRRSKPAKRLHGAQEAGSRAGVEVAGDGSGAAARTSNSSCVDVTCSCPDSLCHDVPVMHADDDVFLRP